MQANYSYASMASRVIILARRGPNRRDAGFAQLGSDIASPGWDEPMFSNREEVSLRLESKIPSRKPATNIEELNTKTRRARGNTRAGMAGPTNVQHPEDETPKKPSRPDACKKRIAAIYE